MVSRHLGATTAGALSVILTLTALFSDVSAQDDNDKDDPRARAKVVFDEGIDLFNRGEFEAACPKLAASIEHFAGIGNRGKLAECYEKIGRTATAMRLYREVALLAGRAGDEVRERVATERADKLEARVARLTIEPGPSLTLPGLHITSGGRELPVRHYKVERPVDPGTHIITARADQHEPYTTTVTLAEGESRTVTVPALSPTAIADDNSEPAPVRSSVPGVVTTAAGVLVAVSGGTVFGLRARASWQDAEAGGCDLGRGLCGDYTAYEHSVAANRNARIADVAVGVGVATALVGGFLWWRAIRSKRRASETISAAPMLGRDHAGAVLSGRF